MRHAGAPPSVLFVNQHYWPDVASTGQHLTDLAEYLATAGFAVEVLTGRAAYAARGAVGPGAQARHGVVIRRARMTGFGRRSHVGRLLDYASFYLRVGAELFRRQSRDVVVFLTTPPLMMFLGAIAKRVRGQRYGIWSMDLHPDAEIVAGMLAPRSPLARLLLWAMAVGYRNADFVVDLGPFMKERLIAKGTRRDKLHTIPVWSRADEIQPTSRLDNPLRRALGLTNKFVIMYSGNAGIVHEFTIVLEAMRQLRDHSDVFWLFVGDGPRRADIESYARREGIGNFEYRGYFPRADLRHTLAVGDVHLVTLRADFAGIAVPGKLYGIMAAARPVAFVGPRACETAEAIMAAGCGVVIHQQGREATEELVDCIRRFASDDRWRESLGHAARVAFERNYEMSINVAHFERILRTSVVS